MRLRLSLISLLAYAYLIFFAIISHFFPIQDAYKSLIGQPGLLIVPYLVGKPLLFISRKFLSVKEDCGFVIDFVIAWSLGVIFMMVLEVFLYVNFLFSISPFIVILLLIATISLFIKEEANFQNLKRRELWLAAFYGFLFSLFVTNFWNYPYSNENDYIRHTFYTLLIVEKNRPLIFYAYLPTLQTLYAVLMKLFNISSFNEPLFLLWSSRFIFYPIYSVGIFLLSYKLSKNRLLSLTSSIIGSSLINSIENSLFPWHTAPKNLVSILFIYVLYASFTLYENRKSKSLNPPIFGISAILTLTFILLYFTKPFMGYELGFLLVPLLLFVLISPKLIASDLRNLYFSLLILLETLVFFHTANGFLGGAFTLIFLLLLTNFERVSLATSKALTAVSMTATSTTFILYNFGLIPYPQKPVLAPVGISAYWMFGWGKLKEYISSTYPLRQVGIPVLLFLLAAGCLYIIVAERDKKILGVSSLASLLILIYFLPIYFSYRMLMYAHPLIIFLSFYAIFGLTKLIFRWTFRLTKVNKPRFRRTSILLLFILLLSSIGLNIYTHDMHQFEKSILIKKQERYQIFQVGKFIKRSVQKDAIVIGYMWYQKLSAFYGMVYPVYLWENGKYRDDVIKEIYLANSSKEAYYKLKELINKEEYIISCPDPDEKEIKRFYKKPSEVIILYDEVLAGWLKNRESINKFFDPICFTVLYVTNNSKGEKFYVFKMNDEPKGNLVG